MGSKSVLTGAFSILLALTVGGWAGGNAGAAGLRNAGIITVPAGHGPAHAASGVRGVNLSGIGSTNNTSGYAAYVYADDGQNTSNTIDEYGAKPSGLTPLGTILTGGATVDVALAQNDIAVNNNSSHGACLVHADSSGLVESFSINLATGLLTTVSSVPEGDGVNYFPSDVKLSPNGNDAYVNIFSFGAGMIVSFPIGAGCALGAAVTFNTTPQHYPGISIPNAHQLFAVDNTGNGTLDIYNIAADGLTLSLQTSTLSQLGSPDGEASGTVGTSTYTFNGQDIGRAETETHTLNTTSGVLGTVPGSPATDPAPFANSGANVLFTSGLNLVTQTEQFSNAVASYNITGGAFNFLTHAALDTTSRGPLSQASISHFLLVESYLTGTIGACQLATTGVRSCVLVATLTTNGSSRTPAGIGVITA